MELSLKMLKRWNLRGITVTGMLCVVTSIAGILPSAHAGDITITIPRHSHLTPVQRLNREGVEAVTKHKYGKAEQLFYKAYLLDPDDPFTLNNLGFISELQGQLDRAQHYYALAAEEPSDARVDQASLRSARNETLKDLIGGAQSFVAVNHANVEAVRLLAQGRAVEADNILQTALKSDPQNVFTLNNLGVAKEMEGEDQEALRFYDESATMHSDATAAVTLNQSSRGRRVSEMAANSAKALRDRLARADQIREQVAELNLQGVSAVNRNDLRAAEQDFRKAYNLDPNSAFTINNIAYVAELDGDRETAQFFYDRAQRADDSRAKVAVATESSAEGASLFSLASDNNKKVEVKETQEQESLRRQHEPVVLLHRDNTPVDESAPQAAPSDQKPQ
jgi:Flp pilus assembly protein TadD